MSVNDNVWCKKHLPALHSWKKKTTQEGKETSPSDNHRHKRRYHFRKRNSTHLWKASRMSRSSAVDSSITIPSVLSPVVVAVQASILLSLLLLVLGPQEEDGSTSLWSHFSFQTCRPVSLWPDRGRGDLTRSCSFLRSAVADRC